jgi:hypothetical protein
MHLHLLTVFPHLMHMTQRGHSLMLPSFTALYPHLLHFMLMSSFFGGGLIEVVLDIDLDMDLTAFLGLDLALTTFLFALVFFFIFFPSWT